MNPLIINLPKKQRRHTTTYKLGCCLPQKVKITLSTFLLQYELFHTEILQHWTTFFIVTNSLIYDDLYRSQSILQFTPTMKHIGKVLVCKASNSQVPGKDIQDDWHLNISCKFLSRNTIISARFLLDYPSKYKIKKQIGFIDWCREN